MSHHHCINTSWFFVRTECVRGASRLGVLFALRTTERLEAVRLLFYLSTLLTLAAPGRMNVGFMLPPKYWEISVCFST